jgi:hypothetical protein
MIPAGNRLPRTPGVHVYAREGEFAHELDEARVVNAVAGSRKDAMNPAVRDPKRITVGIR